MSATKLATLLKLPSDFDPPVPKLDYSSPSLREVKYTYLVDKGLFSAYLVSLGLEDQMNMAHESEGVKSQRDRITWVLPEDEKLTADLQFLQYAISPDWEEKDIVFVRQEVNDFLKEHMPGYFEIKRVLYSRNGELHVERNLTDFRVFFASNNHVRAANFEAIAKSGKPLQFSRFMSSVETLRYLNNVAKFYAKEAPMGFPGNELIVIAELEDGSEGEFKEVFDQTKEICIWDRIAPASFERLKPDSTLIFYYKSQYEDFATNFFKKKQTDGLSCDSCGKPVADDSYYIETCGHAYCGYDCSGKHRNMTGCVAKKCNACFKKLTRSDFIVCCKKCKSFYCSKNCRSLDNHAALQTCSQNEMILSGDFSKLPDNLGLVGLSNIGNTCYMNSALQALLHNAVLKKMMGSPKILEEVNVNNPLGTKGALLKETQELFTLFWKTKGNSVSPSAFKAVVAEHLPTFSGYAQHDSQEFLSQFLDSIHEDTNRIMRKPYTSPFEGKEGDDDEELARRCWVNFLRRNYSKITENFYGQLRSLVKCTKCHNASLTFDPFQLLSLSVPATLVENFQVFAVFDEQRQSAKRFSFTASSNQNFADISVGAVLQCFARSLKAPVERLRWALVGFGHYGEVLNDDSPVSKIYQAALTNESTGRNLSFVFELNKKDMESLKKPDPVLVMFRTTYEKPQPSIESYTYSKKDTSDPIFTKMFYLTRQSTINDLHIAVLMKLVWVTGIPELNVMKNETNFEFEFFEKLWKHISLNQKWRFFKIKLNKQELTPDTYSHRLDELIPKGEERLNIHVLVRQEGLDFSVDLKKFTKFSIEHEFPTNFAKASKSDHDDLTLEDLLRNFSKTETLDSDNKINCSVCKQQEIATKKMEIYKSPEYLTIHFKRQKSNGSSPLIKFSTDRLDMSPFVMSKTRTQDYKVSPEEFYVEQDIEYYKNKNVPLLFENTTTPGLMYKLTGVINHSGSQSFGHYTGYYLVNDKWYDFNDSRVDPVLKKEIVSSHAYVLFYEKIRSGMDIES